MVCIKNKYKQKGGTLVEYALLAAIIAVGCITALSALSQSVSKKFCYISNEINVAGTGGPGSETTGGNNINNSDPCADGTQGDGE